MTELIIEVENESILSSLKKVLSSLDGVKIRKNTARRKTGIELAYEDVKAGRVFSAKNAEDLIRQCLE